MKKRNITLLMILLLGIGFLKAQSIEPQVGLLFTSENTTATDVAGENVVTDASGNIYTTGYFYGTVDFDPSGAATANLSSQGDRDAYVAKYNSNGDYQWAFSIGSSSNDYVNDLALDASGNIYITGLFLNTVDFDPSANTANLTSNGNSDVFMAKYNSNGEYQWAKHIGGTSGETAYSIALDASNNIYIGGSFSETVDFDPDAGIANLISNGSADIYIAKYNNNGEYQWAFNIGGTSADYTYEMELDASNNIYISGVLYNTVDFDPSANTADLTSNGSGDLFVAKYNDNGDYQWAFNIGGTSYDRDRGMVLDASGNIYITGHYYNTVDFDPSASTANLTSNGSADVFVAKYNSNGDYQMAFSVGGTTVDYSYGIALDASDNIYITGSFFNSTNLDPSGTASDLSSNGKHDVYVAKYDNSGTYQWAFNVGGSDQDLGQSIAVDGSANIYLTGYFTATADFDPGSGTANLNNDDGENDTFLAKYNTSGDYQWAKGMEALIGDYEVTEKVITDASGNMYVMGRFTTTIDVDPSANTANLVSNGGYDIFLAKYDASGNYLWAFSIGGIYNDTCNDMILDASGNIYLTGEFNQTVDFDPSVNTSELISNGSTDTFVAKYNSNGEYQMAFNIGNSYNEGAYGIALDGLDNIYITGSFYDVVDFDPGAGTAELTTNGYYDMFLAKYNSSGEYQWAFNVGGNNYFGDSGDGIVIDGSDNIYVMGIFTSDADFDPSANTATLTNNGSRDAYVAKYNSNGNYQWAFGIGGSSSDYVNGIELDASDNIYITGYFQNTVDFDPSANTADLTSNGSSDIYMAKYNSSGDYQWAKHIGASANEYAQDITLNAVGDIYITGTFEGTVDFDSGTDTNELTSNGENDIFVTKYNNDGDYQWAFNIGSSNDEYVYDINIDNSDNVYIGGSFSATSINIHPQGTSMLNASDDVIHGLAIKYSICDAPSDEATTLIASSTAASITVSSFTAPTDVADGYAIYINDTNSFTAPNDGDEPTADLSWNGSGQQAVYFGTSASPNITITNLNPNTDYYITIYAYTDCSGTETYGNLGLNATQSTSSTFVTKADGNWSDITCWMGETVPTGTYTGVDIDHNITLTAEVDLSALTVGIDVAGGTLNLDGNNILLGSNSGITAGEMNIDDLSASDEGTKGGYIEATNKIVGKGAAPTDVAGLGLTISDVQLDIVNIASIKRYHYQANGGMADPILFDITGTIGGTCDLEITSAHSVSVTIYKYAATGWEISTGDDLSGGFSLWTTSSSPLPISLLSFEVTRANENEVLLTWTTASEKNNAGFEIQISDNGKDFQKVGFVEGQGNASQITNYQFTIDQSSSGYYRLKQIDFDGSFEYSAIKFVDGIETNLAVNIYPNPSQGEIHVDIPDYKEEIKIHIFNIQGKEILNISGTEEVLNENLNHIFPNLDNGLYIFKVQVLDKVWTKRIILHR